MFDTSPPDEKTNQNFFEKCKCQICCDTHQCFCDELWITFCFKIFTPTNILNFTVSADYVQFWFVDIGANQNICQLKIGILFAFCP